MPCLDHSPFHSLQTSSTYPQTSVFPLTVSNHFKLIHTLFFADLILKFVFTACLCQFVTRPAKMTPLQTFPKRTHLTIQQVSLSYSFPSPQTINPITRTLSQLPLPPNPLIFPLPLLSYHSSANLYFILLI